MDPLPTSLLKDTEPTTFEEKAGKVPILGAAVARALQHGRFEPVVKEYKRMLKERSPEEAQSLWHPDDLDAAQTIMKILKEEIGWKHPYFIPDDPCYVAFWSYRDALDVVDATERVEEEFKIVFTEQDEENTVDYTLQDLVSLIKNKSQPGEVVNASSAAGSSENQLHD